ncbi:hypothetical protein [Tepidibacter mesophilus]|uniref:hypothetical protein n=1 Tax=Tepidibacter mesophilus TaxID=655607 RepID=UPI000C08AF73|nr:hypothetical protein [Tepidibacter mesophilus]
MGDLISISCCGVIHYELNNAYPSKKVLINLVTILEKEVLCDSYYKFIIKDYGNILKKWREKNKFKIYEACKILDFSENTYIAWKNRIQL